MYVLAAYDDTKNHKYTEFISDLANSPIIFWGGQQNVFVPGRSKIVELESGSTVSFKAINDYDGAFKFELGRGTGEIYTTFTGVEITPSLQG